MPNWCLTTYKCVGAEDETRQLREILESLKANPSVAVNDFGSMWLGNLVAALGKDWQKYSCRGHITNVFPANNGALGIDMETAWGEQSGVRKAIEERFPSIKVYFIDEEPGNCRYVTNDLTGQWFRDEWKVDDGNCTLYFGTIEEAAKRVANIVGHNVRPDMCCMLAAACDYNQRYDTNIMVDQLSRAMF